MHDGLRAMLAEHSLYRSPVGQVPLDEGRIRVNRGPVALVKVIEDHHRFAGLDELFYSDAANVACAAGYENLHRAHSLSSFELFIDAQPVNEFQTNKRIVAHSFIRLKFFDRFSLTLAKV